jgi:uncharacterized protein with FMN-binding domain
MPYKNTKTISSDDLENLEREFGAEIMAHGVEEGKGAPVDSILAILGAAGEDYKALMDGAASATATASAAATQTTAPVTTTIKDGTYTGPVINVNYGNVQVKITVSNGKITDAVAVKAPKGKNDRYTNMAVPILKAQTLQAQSANIQGASGASYTSYGWFKSLQGALADAGF